MRQEKVGLLAVANERRKTERAIDAILKLRFSGKLVCTSKLIPATTSSKHSTTAFPDGDGVVRQDSGNFERDCGKGSASFDVKD